MANKGREGAVTVHSDKLGARAWDFMEAFDQADGPPPQAFPFDIPRRYLKGGRTMSEVVIEVNPEVEDLVYRMRAAGDRLAALAQERPGVRWRVGDTVYRTEGQLLRSMPVPADPR